MNHGRDDADPWSKWQRGVRQGGSVLLLADSRANPNPSVFSRLFSSFLFLPFAFASLDLLSNLHS